eukprot:s2438_g8.t1
MKDFLVPNPLVAAIGQWLASSKADEKARCHCLPPPWTKRFFNHRVRTVICNLRFTTDTLTLPGAMIFEGVPCCQLQMQRSPVGEHLASAGGGEDV